MTKFLAAKVLGGLRPIDEMGEAVLRHIKQKEIVSIELARPRNVKFHRRLFAMLRIVLQNQEHYKSIEDLLDVCKIRIGHCRTIATRDGEVKIPLSISFSALDDIGFADIYDRAVTWMVTEVIPGLERHDLDEEVREQLLGFGD